MTHAIPPASDSENPGRQPPAWLLALGRQGLPDRVRAEDGTEFVLNQVFKHDFFAATALYQSSDGRKAVLKIGRRAWLGPIPMRWAGRFLCNREVRLYQLLQGLDGIPRYLGRHDDTGFLHEYIEGRPLRRDDRPPDDFFPRLRTLIDAVHVRDAAYVDLEKRENILLGDDKRPYLIDFQISWHRPGVVGRLPPLSWLRRILQSSDDYHLLKHWRRHRGDQLDAAQLERSRRPPLWIAWHRYLFRPFTVARRHVLVWLRARDSAHTRAPG